MQTGLWRSELGGVGAPQCWNCHRLITMMISIMDYFINRRSLLKMEMRCWEGTDGFLFFFLSPFPVAPKCAFHLTLECALHKCRWNSPAPPSSKWSFNGTVCTGAGNSMGRCHCRWELRLNQSVKPHHLPQQMIQKPLRRGNVSFFMYLLCD